ncbi:hypothetical protein GOBAR_AA00931 [Gossypium barbadense]|uniref:Uncharacterized protein n=1 Tax=Gossypium barbadense TaxID=3634 RepID=A0A2P5YVK2_GOSBA|nr:hypothetical protein GOBAR_AA00931 [Gossypium barbadense]
MESQISKLRSYGPPSHHQEQQQLKMTEFIISELWTWNCLAHQVFAESGIDGIERDKAVFSNDVMINCRGTNKKRREMKPGILV